MLNVLINLPGLSDKAFVAAAEKEATAVCDQVKKRCDKIFDDVVQRIRNS
jgi:formiminotetrahydrofolate cyclodeaminase